MQVKNISNSKTYFCFIKQETTIFKNKTCFLFLENSCFDIGWEIMENNIKSVMIEQLAAWISVRGGTRGLDMNQTGKGL